MDVASETYFKGLKKMHVTSLVINLRSLHAYSTCYEQVSCACSIKLHESPSTRYIMDT